MRSKEPEKEEKKEGFCEEQRFRGGEGQIKDKGVPGSSHCRRKMCEHTDSLTNSVGYTRFDRDGKQHMQTTPNRRGEKADTHGDMRAGGTCCCLPCVRHTPCWSQGLGD